MGAGLVILAVLVLGWLVFSHVDTGPSQDTSKSAETTACDANGGMQTAYLTPSGDIVCPDGMVERWDNGVRIATASCVGHGDPAQAYAGKHGVQCADATLVTWTSG